LLLRPLALQAFQAFGLVSLGFLSFGLLPFGFLAVGAVPFGLLAFELLEAIADRFVAFGLFLLGLLAGFPLLGLLLAGFFGAGEALAIDPFPGLLLSGLLLAGPGLLPFLLLGLDFGGSFGLFTDPLGFFPFFAELFCAPPLFFAFPCLFSRLFPPARGVRICARLGRRR
jgi:hypothetical protein